VHHRCTDLAGAGDVKRPPEFPRAALSIRRLAILRGDRRVGAGGRNFPILTDSVGGWFHGTV
jgi:hypothetical protein